MRVTAKVLRLGVGEGQARLEQVAGGEEDSAHAARRLGGREQEGSGDLERVGRRGQEG